MAVVPTYLNINPAWTWSRWSNVSLSITPSDDLSPTPWTATFGRTAKDFPEYIPTNETPALHQTARLFAEQLEQPDANKMDIVQKWIRSYGFLHTDLEELHTLEYEYAEIAPQSEVDENLFPEVPHTYPNFFDSVKWVLDCIDSIRSLGIEAKDVTVADNLKVPITPVETLGGDLSLIFDELEGEDLETTGTPDENGKVLYPYDSLLQQLFFLIEHYTQDVRLTFSEPVMWPRDGLGQRVQKSRLGTGQFKREEDLRYRIQTVATPDNLATYIWLLIQEQLMEPAPARYQYYQCVGQAFNTCTNYLKRKEGSHHCQNCNEPLGKEKVVSLDSTGQFTTTNAEYVAVDQPIRQGFCVGLQERHVPKVKWREWCSPNCRKRALRRGVK